MSTRQRFSRAVIAGDVEPQLVRDFLKDKLAQKK
jgi:hypothetical protein